jgi:hypothetical protein
MTPDGSPIDRRTMLNCETTENGFCQRGIRWIKNQTIALHNTTITNNHNNPTSAAIKSGFRSLKCGISTSHGCREGIDIGGGITQVVTTILIGFPAAAFIRTLNPTGAL